jgi:hypothetical protein
LLHKFGLFLLARKEVRAVRHFSNVLENQGRHELFPNEVILNVNSGFLHSGLLHSGRVRGALDFPIIILKITFIA